MVAWFDHQPPREAREALEDRGFLVGSVAASQLKSPIDLIGLCAVVFTQSDSKRTQVIAQLTAHAELLLDCDVRVIVRPTTDASAAGALSGLGERLGLEVAEPSALSMPDPPSIRIFGASDGWNVVANYILEHPPGPAPRPEAELQITLEDSAGNPATLKSSADEILLRRAFWDCSALHLKPMPVGGKSGATTFRGFAEIAESEHGKWPVPYFIKLETRGGTAKEYGNYLKHVAPYVPFHLGPHLATKRCCLGARKGILVGDFVDESESLLSCAPDGRAAAALSCLFDRTLVGWYRSAMPYPKPLSSWLRAPATISVARLARARVLGATLSPSELAILVNRCTASPTLCGARHGDLHARNILVRATDAIIIDFMRHEVGPLVCDVACLEASLLVDGFADAIGNQKPEALLASLVPLYDRLPTTPGIPDANPRDPSRWFYRAVRQLRLHAHQMETENRQYAGALACALLGQAKRGRNASEPEASLRAVAYVLAERVLLHAFGPLVPSGSPA